MNESPLPANVRALRKHLGLRQIDFAKAVGSQQAAVSKWESGADQPSGRPLSKLAELACTSVDDFCDQPWSPPIVPMHQAPDRFPTRSASEDDDVVELVALDLSLSMGPGTLIEDIVESEPVKFDMGLLRAITRSPYHRIRMVRGVGDSMEPTLRTGDRVMVDTTERALARLDGVYWVNIFGAQGIKRLKMVAANRVAVVSDNPSVEDKEYDLSDVRIEGRVIWFAREL